MGTFSAKRVSCYQSFFLDTEEKYKTSYLDNMKDGVISNIPQGQALRIHHIVDHIHIKGTIQELFKTLQ